MAAPKKGKRSDSADQYKLPLPDVTPSRADFYDRKRLPPKLLHFTLPAYLRQAKCALIDDDERNDGLANTTRGIVHYDMNNVMDMPFANAYLMSLPEKISINDPEPRTTTLPSFVLHPKPLTNADTPPSAVQIERETHINEAFSRAVRPRLLCHHDPREIAASILIIFMHYRYHQTDDENMRAAVFLANVVLLAESEVPIPLEAMGDNTLRVAVALDAKKWIMNRKVSTEMTAAYLKSLVRKCNACGGMRTRDGVVMLPAAACNGCSQAFYCSKECLEKDWLNHKQFCKENREAKVASMNRANARRSAPPPIQTIEDV